MHKGYTYGITIDNRYESVALYANPDFEPPETITLEFRGKPAIFTRMSDRQLSCHKADGGCGSEECHRWRLGFCRCGFHAYPVQLRTRAQDLDARAAGR